MPYSPDDQVTGEVKKLIEELERHRRSSTAQTLAIIALTIVLILQGFGIL